jgi:hypothetical protein
MRRLLTAVAVLLLAATAQAHEWTPTYPKFKPSFLDGIVVTTMSLFNKRKEIEYYDISIFDQEWQPVPFATTSKLVHVSYLETKIIDIYIREVDCERIEYICTESKILTDDTSQTGVTSRICSKV